MSELAILKQLCAAGPTLDFTSLASCRGMDPNIFYPEKGVIPPYDLCQTCPVRLDCLAWALCHERSGMWGGVSKNGRAKLRRKLGVECWAPEVGLTSERPGCGTEAGCQVHYRKGEKPCDKCRTAHNEARFAQRKAKRQREAALGKSA